MVVKAPLESKILDIVNAVYPQYSLAFCGGGSMKCHTASEDETIGKTTTFIGISDFPRYKESPQCSKCGACADNCPEGLRVNKIAELVDINKLDKVNRYNAERCLNCGICSSICPAGRNLSSRVQAAREYLKSHKSR
jgi:electron transport complex protein RnfC